jgi:putative inorganic carbon (hco3(-)) transporter
MSQISDYEGFPIRRKRPGLAPEETDAPWPQKASAEEDSAEPEFAEAKKDAPAEPASAIVGAEDGWNLTSGHLITFIALYLFSIVLYFRPYELVAALSSYTSMAFVIGMVTLAIYFISQFVIEGNLTARPREINLILLFLVAAFLSMPLATNPGEAYDTFTDVLLKAILIFIVLVNVIRTEWRLKLMVWLAFAVSVYLSVNAMNDYTLGVFREGSAYYNDQRIGGSIGGLFGNSNDLALHLVTMVPLAIGFAFATNGVLRKLLYFALAGIFVGAVVVTFSRGGFIGLVIALLALTRKLGRKNKFLSTGALVVAISAVLIFAPGNYIGRLSSILNSAADFTGSSTQRTEILKRSIWVTLRYPLFGVGMGNFHYKSVQELVTHNAYTQVSSEMGIPALIVYLMLMIYPLRKLRRIEAETLDDPQRRKFHYWSIGVQASMIAYMASSFFASVAYQWYIYYLVGYAVAVRRLYYMEQVKNAP